MTDRKEEEVTKMGLFYKKKAEYISWGDYQARVAMKEMNKFQQQTRRQSIRNMPGAGEAK